MSKINIVFFGLAIANLAIFVYLVKDSALLREQVNEIANIRIQLPEEFKKDVADKTIASTEEMSKDALERASKCIVEYANRMSQESKTTVERLSSEVNTNLHEVIKHAGGDVERSVSAIKEFLRQQDEKGVSKANDAATAFAAFESNPTNEIAMLYLQIAIRKNPTELKYIRTMKNLVERSGMDSGLVQEYQTMLSYCLDEATVDCLGELTMMVKDFRAYVAKQEIGTDPLEEQENEESKIAMLQEQLSTNALVVAFDDKAVKTVGRRIEILKELQSIDGSGDYSIDLANAELIALVAKADGRIRGYMKQTEWEISHAGAIEVSSESDLRSVLNALGATAVSQPIVLAQQSVQALYGMDLTAYQTNVVEACVEKFRSLDALIQNYVGCADKMKASKIKAFVDRVGMAPTVVMTETYTDQLKRLEEQGKIISKYIGCISNAEIANDVLAKQLSILEKTRDVQRKRVKKYQVNSSNEMKEIAKKIRQYKDDAWRKEYKKDQAVPLLKRLVKIDPTLLVPEINELYQYEYSQLMADFNAWIEKENDYEYKAKFMVELEGIMKNKMEDL